MADEATPEAETPAEGQPDVDAAIKEAIEEVGKTPPEGETPAEPTQPDGKPPEQAAETPEAKRTREVLAAAARREGKALQKEREAQRVMEEAKAFRALREAAAGGKPSDLFKALGLDPRVFLRALTNEDQPPEVTAESEIAELKKWRADFEAQKQQNERNELVARHTAEVKKAIEAGGDRFELINAQGEHDLVWETMVAYHQIHGEAPDALAIADAVEADLAEKAGKALATKKFKGRAAPQAATNSRDTKPRQPLPGETTISNRDVPASPSNDDEGPMDPYEREHWAARAVGVQVMR